MEVLASGSQLKGVATMSTIPRPAHSATPDPHTETNQRAGQEDLPGWFWRTPEGRAYLDAIRDKPASLALDEEMGWQREDD
jgi:hypothetical protein